MKLPQKILAVTLITLTSLVGVGIGWGYYTWRQLTQLPDWYQTSKNPALPASVQFDAATIQKNQRTLRQKLQTQIQAQVPPSAFLNDSAQDSSASPLGLPVTLPPTSKAIALQLDNDDLQQVLLDGIARNPKTQPLLKATRGVKTTITDQRIAIGTVLNSQDVLQSWDHSPASPKIQQFFQQFPQFKNRDLSIQIEGTPTLTQGKLILDDQSTLTIGSVKFSMAELAQRLGISTAQIRQYLTINANAHRLQSIQLQENQMILEIAPDPSKGDN